MTINPDSLPANLPPLTQIQYKFAMDFLSHKYRFYYIPAARRSGKTMLGKFASLKFATSNGGVRGLLGGPVEHQAKQIFWQELMDRTKDIRKGKNASELSVTLKNNSYLRVVGLDEPARIEGPRWEFAHITETGNCKEEIMGHLRPVLSQISPITGKPGWAIFEGTPRGLNWYYEKVLDICDGVIPRIKPEIGAFHESRGIKDSAFYSWFTSDVIPIEEVEAAKHDMDYRTWLQMYYAEFLGALGRAYYTFTDKNVQTVLYNPAQTIHGGIDFNVNPMTMTLGHKNGREYHQFAELYLPHSNTPALCKKLIRMYPEKKTNLVNTRTSTYTRTPPASPMTAHQILLTLKYSKSTASPSTVPPATPTSPTASTPLIRSFAPPTAQSGSLLTPAVSTPFVTYSRSCAKMTAQLTSARRRMAWCIYLMPSVILFVIYSHLWQKRNISAFQKGR